MRTSKLIKKLTNLCIKHSDPRVGFTGHYGEFYELDDSDVNITRVGSDECHQPIKSEMVVDISMPYIGEEPD